MLKRFMIAVLIMLCVRPALAAELVMLSKPGCYYCDRFMHEVGKVYDQSIESMQAPLRIIRADKEVPAEYVHLTQTTFSPVFVLVHEGREYGRIVGYPGRRIFWPMLNELLDRLPVEVAQSGS